MYVSSVGEHMEKKSMKQYYEEKVQRNNLILEKMKTEKTPEELTRIVYPEFKNFNQETASISEIRKFRYKKRNIYNDLKFLLDLNIIVSYETRGTYQIAGIKEKKFQGAELEMAINHARSLILSDPIASIFGSSTVVDYLAFNCRGIIKGKQILEHLETGYPEIYEILMEYKKMVDESDYIPDCKKPFPIPIGSYRELPKHIAPIKEKLVGKFEVRIMQTVKEGQPLLGECHQCPDKRFKIS
jgi:hypothetical protein